MIGEALSLSCSFQGGHSETFRKPNLPPVAIGTEHYAIANAPYAGCHLVPFAGRHKIVNIQLRQFSRFRQRNAAVFEQPQGITLAHAFFDIGFELESDKIIR